MRRGSPNLCSPSCTASLEKTRLPVHPPSRSGWRRVLLASREWLSHLPVQGMRAWTVAPGTGPSPAPPDTNDPESRQAPASPGPLNHGPLPSMAPPEQTRPARLPTQGRTSHPRTRPLVRPGPPRLRWPLGRSRPHHPLENSPGAGLGPGDVRRPLQRSGPLPILPRSQDSNRSSSRSTTRTSSTPTSTRTRTTSRHHRADQPPQ